MNNNVTHTLIAAFTWCFSRVAVLYVLLLVLIFTTIDISAVNSRIKIRRLNDLRPDMSELVALNKNTIDAKNVRWSVLLNYFDTILQYMPEASTPQFFMGICQYYSSNTIKKPLQMIRSSADRSPYIFWNLYDTGVLSFINGDLNTALLYLNRSLMIPSDKAAYAMKGEVLYRQLMSSPNFDTDLSHSIDQAKKNIPLLLTAAYYYSGDPTHALTLAANVIQNQSADDLEPFYFFAGVSALQLKQTQSAVAHLSKCIALKTQNPYVYQYLSEILSASGKSDEAKTAMAVAIKLRANNPSPFPYPEYLRVQLF